MAEGGFEPPPTGHEPGMLTATLLRRVASNLLLVFFSGLKQVGQPVPWLFGRRENSHGTQRSLSLL